MRGNRGATSVGCVAGLALLVAVAALLLAWSAYRRTGGRLDQLSVDIDPIADAADRPAGAVRDALDQGRRQVERQTALAQAEARLMALRGEAESGRGLAAVEREVARVRGDLARAFAGAGDAAGRRWHDLDNDLEKLDQQLHEGGSRAAAALDHTVERIRAALSGEGAGR
jgi:hypothetical protein